MRRGKSEESHTTVRQKDFKTKTISGIKKDIIE